ncbi:MAG: electron transfer flavoprotein subunit beta/FixA family protein [Sphaerochaetaceae bacterium]|nr:electron transfer flavoprotein subunit beta/FixA family protein [Sphaerochaetaceae bacterium]
MHIVVPIKQVPETSDVHMDALTGTMIRSGNTAIINPLDLYAIESALKLKDRIGATVSVLTMGPTSAVKVLKEAMAMGCDAAVHLSDRKFAGADTWSTSYVLSLAIRNLSPVDLIMTGERATDGDTGQVTPEVASWLDLPLVSFLSSISTVQDGILEGERLIEEGYQKIRCLLPAVVSVVKEVGEPRLPTLRGKKRAMTYDIPVWTADELKAEESFLGLKGSPTRVVRIGTPSVIRDATVVQASGEYSLKSAVSQLLDFLDEKGLLTEGGTHA